MKPTLQAPPIKEPGRTLNGSASKMPQSAADAPQKHGMSVVVVKDVSALVEHVPAWEALAGAVIEPNVFYEPWMLLPAVKAFGAGVELQFVLIYKPQPSNPKGPPVLCGFFPLERRRLYGGLPVRNLCLWKHIHCYSCVPLLRAEFARECLEEFFSWLASDAQNGAFLELPLLLGEGPLHQLLVGVFHGRDLVPLVTESFLRALFRPRQNAEQYLQDAISGEQRKKMRRRERRLSELGKVEYVALESDGDVAAWLEKFLQVEASGWKGKEQSALASKETDRGFFLEITSVAHRLRKLELFAMYLDSRPIAYQCCFMAEPGAFAFKTAFDENYSSYGPGILLQIDLIQRLHARKDVQWMDSCGDANSFLTSLWIDRKTIQTILIPTGKWPGDFVVAALPMLKWFKYKLTRLRTGKRKPKIV